MKRFHDVLLGVVIGVLIMFCIAATPIIINWYTDAPNAATPGAGWATLWDTGQHAIGQNPYNYQSASQHITWLQAYMLPLQGGTGNAETFTGVTTFSGLGGGIVAGTGTQFIGNGPGLTNVNATAYGGSSGPITLPVSGSYFMAPNNDFTNATSDTSGVTRSTAPANGTLANLYVTASSNPGAVANTVTILTNGTSTGITVTLNNVTSASDIVDTAPVLAGYEIGIKVVTGAGNAVRWGWGFQLK